MKSITKNLLSGDKIRELAKINFGYSCEVKNITELKGGMFNAIYIMERANEKDYIVLKIGVTPETPLLTYERNIMQTEVECLRLVSEQTVVPVPKVLAYDFSKKHIPSDYFFMSALEGVPLSSVSKKMPPENLNKIKSKLADYLAQIHMIKGTYYGYFTADPNKQYGSWKEAFAKMFEQILSDSRARHTRLPYERIERALKENSVYLENTKAPSLVNFDCHEGNIFVKKTDGEYRIEGIIDLERSFWGDPIADFPTAFIFTDDIRKEKSFLDEYLNVSSKKSVYTEADAKLYQLYRMYILVIMAAEIFRYGFLYGQMQSLWAKFGIMKCLKELEK